MRQGATSADPSGHLTVIESYGLIPSRSVSRRRHKSFFSPMPREAKRRAKLLRSVPHTRFRDTGRRSRDVTRLSTLLRPDTSACTTCSSAFCPPGQYLSGCGGASAGACVACPSGSYLSNSPGKLVTRGRLREAAEQCRCLSLHNLHGYF